jgi:hypothetical protein
MRELKKSVRRTLQRTGTPLRLWPYCMELCAAVQRLTANSIPQLNGRTPTEYVEGSTLDISSYAMFDWYQPIYYYNPVIGYSQEKKVIGGWLDVAEDCNNVMAYVVSAGKGKVFIWKSVWGIPDEDLAQASIKEKLDTFDLGVKSAYDHRWPATPTTIIGNILD